MHRVRRVMGHLTTQPAAALEESKTNGSGGEDSNLRWDGWGYKDTGFELNSQGLVSLTGNRYLFSGKTLPNLRSWMEEAAGLDINLATPTQDKCKISAPIVNDAFMAAVKPFSKITKFDDLERLFHGHGHTCLEMYRLKFGEYKRVPDVVIYPGTHEDVEGIVKAAVQHNVVIIPFGGGTSVSWALLCPENENRMIVSLDMREMNRIKWINRKNMLACIEAGAAGKDIESHLRKYGLVLGHEPDSAEFSTMGGWIATRASGMRKNKYGNIEDILINFKVVTPIGTITKSVQVPRVSTGPDLSQIILGSEGQFGVVTEAVVRLRPAPEETRYGSLIFPSFEQGVACLTEVALKRLQPVSIRLVDNRQFQFGQVLKPGAESWRKAVVEKVKKWYVLHKLKFDPDQMVAATLLFEGTHDEINRHEKSIYAIAAKHGGMKAGEENGIRGYFLTYMIGYLRDFGLNYSFMAESFETSVSFDNILILCHNVKEVIQKTCDREGVVSKPFISSRVTQLYDTGAAVYFYFGFIWDGLPDPLATFAKVEHAAREEILKLGGSLSHHHGVGKLRSEFMPKTVGDNGITVLKALKNTIDPTNVFGNGNLGLTGAVIGWH